MCSQYSKAKTLFKKFSNRIYAELLYSFIYSQISTSGQMTYIFLLSDSIIKG